MLSVLIIGVIMGNIATKAKRARAGTGFANVTQVQHLFSPPDLKTHTVGDLWKLSWSGAD